MLIWLERGVCLKGVVSRILGAWDKFLFALAHALPVITYFTFSFLVVYAFFGLKYTIVTSITAIFFSSDVKKNSFHLSRYVYLALYSVLFLSIVTFFAPYPVWRVFFSFLIPFLVVATKSSQFSPHGYFQYVMLYVFLSLAPPENMDEYMMELEAMLFSIILLASILYLVISVRNKEDDDELDLPGLFSSLSALIPLLGDADKRRELEDGIEKLLDKVGKASALKGALEPIYTMAFTLLQRFSYITSDYEGKETLDVSEIRELRKLSSFMYMASVTITTKREGEIVRTGNAMLSSMDIPEGRVRIFIRSVLHMIVMMTEYLENGLGDEVKKEGFLSRLVREIPFRFSLDAFELRFALRLSMVMGISQMISVSLPITHSYWIDLNAFLLMQPTSEESIYRMKTRPIGTALGCVLMAAIYPYLTTVSLELEFAILMIALMYCSRPGTWNQPIFSTAYALTMASMSIEHGTALALRLFFLMIAVMTVFVVNRFFFPIRKCNKLSHNFWSLFRLHNSYWQIIREGINGDTELSVSSDILSHFHLYLSEAGKNAEGNEKLEEVLLILWHMFSELEQIHYLVRTKSLDKKEKEELLDLIDAIQKDLYPIIRDEDFPPLLEKLHFQRKDFSFVLNQYLAHSKELLAYKAYIPF